MKSKMVPGVVVNRKDLEITYYNPPGNGGQAKNKTMNGVHMKHPPSGVMYSDHSTRSKIDNERAALAKISKDPRFIKWVRVENAKLGVSASEIHRRVEEQINPKNIRIEVLVDGKWKKEE